MERVNIMLAPDESEWLDALVREIQAQNGGKVSRSEIVRAALAGMRELHSSSLKRPSKLVPFHLCRSGSDLMIIMMVAIRIATEGAV